MDMGKHFGGRLFSKIAAVFLLGNSLWAQSGGGSSGVGGPGYGGPAVSSRGLRGVGSRAGEAVSIRPFVSATGVYDDGLIVAGLTPEGGIGNPGGLYGVELTLGAYGAKEWRKTRIGLDYTGLYRHYSQASFFNGSDHLMDMDMVHQVTRRSYFLIRGTGGTSSRPVGGLFSLAYLDPTRFGIPTGDVFDNRTYFVDAAGQYVVNLGARNSFSLSGNGFAVRRQSSALIGMNGHRAGADFTRRLTRRTTIGAGYQYIHFDFPRFFGESDIHLVLAEVGREINRSLRFSVAFGGYRVDLTGVREVRLDPVLAALFGTTSGRQAFNAINQLPFWQATVQHDQRKSSFLLNWASGPTGGSGVLLTSKQQTGQATWSYRGNEKWSFGLNAFYQEFSGLGSFQGGTTSYGFGSSFSYRLRGDLYLSGGNSVRRFASSFTTSEFRRTGNRAFVGLTYSPGAIPVSLR
jgi:hypothetical protein